MIKAFFEFATLMLIILATVVGLLRLIFLLFRPKWMQIKYFIDGPDKMEQAAHYIAVIAIGIYCILYKLGYA